jgi:hypothetical protein
VRELKSYDEEATLIWKIIENGKVTEKTIDVFVSEESITRQEFYASYQAGLKPTCVYELNKYDYEMSKHLDTATNKPLYASQIRVNGATYNITRTYGKRDNESVELVCS